MIVVPRSNLLGTEKFRIQLARHLNAAKEEVIVISAFIKTIGIEWLSKNISNPNVKCSIVARLSANDIAQGASDLDIYNITKKNNWDLKILKDLHAKVILIDKKYLFIGSPNLTGRGMKLSPVSNIELGISTISDEEDIRIINQMVSESNLVNDELYQHLKIWEKTLNKIKKEEIKFSDKITELMDHKITKIWINDFPTLTYSDVILSKNIAEKADDMRLFDLEIGFKKDELDKAFLSSRIFRWLLNIIHEQENKEIYFGSLSSKIHNSVYENPKPYRSTIKELQQNLYSYIRNTDSEIFIDKPGKKSQRLYLK